MEQMSIEAATAIANSFLDSYRSAFEGYDTEAILSHFVYPAHFVIDAADVERRPVADRDACRPGVERIQAWHRAIGYRSGRVARLSVSPLSPRMISMQIEFEIQDARGARLYDFLGVYTLVQGDGGWKIAAISHNQVPRLLACVAATGSQA